jgi:hypothetical protein
VAQGKDGIPIILSQFKHHVYPLMYLLFIHPRLFLPGLFFCIRVSRKFMHHDMLFGFPLKLSKGANIFLLAVMVAARVVLFVSIVEALALIVFLPFMSRVLFE